MLKKLSQLTVMGILTAGLIVFQGCKGEDISAPDTSLDETGNPVGADSMMGGDDKGAGGDDTGAGGDDTGAGGEDTGAGGEDTGAGGEDTGAGGEDKGADGGESK